MNNIPYYGPDDVKVSLKYEELVSALELALADFSKGPDGGVSQPLRATAVVTQFNGLDRVSMMEFFFLPNTYN